MKNKLWLLLLFCLLFFIKLSAQNYHATTAFGLKGNIKEVYINDKLTYEFYKDGRLKVGLFESEPTYDANGYIIRINTIMGSTNIIYYPANSGKLLCKESPKQYDEEYGEYYYNEEYLYNNEGQIEKQIKTLRIPSIDNDDEFSAPRYISKVEFSNYKIDVNGNYIFREFKRYIIDKDGISWILDNSGQETVRIVYWDGH